MNKIYHLSTCSTCARILKRFDTSKFELQDIKTDPITESQIEEMKKGAGSYEALFSRRAMKYRAMGLHEVALNETDYKKHILEEYTFLKRPVIFVDGEIFVGNSAKTVDQAVAKFEGLGIQRLSQLILHKQICSSLKRVVVEQYLNRS